jgi:hypothetical protein
MFIISMTLDVTCAEHFVVTAKKQTNNVVGRVAKDDFQHDGLGVVGQHCLGAADKCRTKISTRSLTIFINSDCAMDLCCGISGAAAPSTRRARSSTRSRSSMQHVVAMREPSLHCGDLLGAISLQ